MKKLMLTKGEAVACLILLCIFLVQGCKKDLLQPNSNVLEHGLSINEAKAFFNTHLQKANGPSKLMSMGASGKSVTPEDIIKNKQPLWDYAYNQMLSKGQAIKIPIDFGNAFVEVTKKSKALLPLSSLSYLYMYKDSLQNIHAEWVLLKPDSAWLFGKRDSYSGRISIRDWNGKSLRFYDYISGQVVSKLKSLKQQRLSSLGKLQNTQSTEEIIPDPTGGGNGDYYCLTVTTGRCPGLSPCSSSWCDMCTSVCASKFCTFVAPDCRLCDDPPTGPIDNDNDGGGDTPASNPGGGGGTSPNDYPPSCNSDPNYTVPNYPAPPGYDWILPCTDAVPIPVEPVDNGDDDHGVLPISDTDQMYSPDLNRTITFGEVREALENNEAVLDIVEGELEFGEHDNPWFPGQTSLEVLNEYRALKALDPHGSFLLAKAYWNVMGGNIHFMLDLVGLVPVVGEAADVANGAIYFLEGNKLDAAISLGSAIPVWGWVSTGGKWVKVAITAKPVGHAISGLAFRAITTTKGTVRFVRVAANTFSHSALRVLKAVKPADNTLTNLSRQLIDQAGKRIAPTLQSLKTKIDDIVMNGDDLGIKTEGLCDDIFETNGFVKHDAKIGSNNGFDGVYIKKDASGNVEEIIINEAKPIKTTGNIKLNAGNLSTGLSPQMSNAWINNMITKLDNQGGNLSTLASVLEANKSKITKTVTGVDKVTKEIVVLKLASY